MLDDANAVPRGTRIRAGVCIVGAGAAGITLARELAGGTHDVVVLESGGLDLAPATQHLYRGTSTGLPYDLEASRLRYFGGSTNHWSGFCRPLDPHDFEARDWIPNSGWPFGRADLDPYYRRAQPICDLGPFQYDVEWWLRRLPDLRPLLHTPTVRTAMYQIGPPTRFGTKYRAELRSAKRLRLLLRANAVDVRVDAGRVTGIDVKTLAGNEFAVDAPVVVLALGGIENARLLLASRQQHPAGLGNDHDLVGRFFMDHPHYEAGTLVLADRAPGVRLHLFNGVPFSEAGIGETGDPLRTVLGALSLTPDAARDARLPGFGATLLFASPATEDGETIRDADMEHFVGDIEGRDPAARPPAVDAPLGDSVVKISRRVGVFVRAEPMPNPESRVTLNDDVDRLGVPTVNLHWALTEADDVMLGRVTQIIGRELGRGGLGRASRRLAPAPQVVGGNHHIGTTRMHADPTLGVVDGNCEVHGVPGLYVAGSSVFPTAGFANPTLTIVALALRMAEHIDEVLAA